MSLTEQVFAQALLLAGELTERQTNLLQVLAETTVTVLTRRLKEGLTPEDCRADFVAAAGLYALAALSEAGADGELEQIALGDVTLKRKQGNAAANCLRNQAELILFPYCRDRFAFVEV